MKVIEFSKFMVIERRANSANLFRPKLSVTLGLLSLDSNLFIKVFVAMFEVKLMWLFQTDIQLRPVLDSLPTS